jgi:glycosyltransferase involved in cell wall biosynthesis
MKVLVFTHHLEIGGSQVNAIDLATTARDAFGHEVVLFATPGPAAALVATKGLRLIEAPRPRVHPSPTMAAALARAVRRERPDVIHAWDWPQALDAFYGVHLPLRVPMISSVMAMTVLNAVPQHITITMGTEQLVHEAQERRHGTVELLEPPVDTELDNPTVVETGEFRSRWNIDETSLTIVVVSRLTSWLKLEGLERAIAAVESLARTRDSVRLLIVGEGPAAARVADLAAVANARLGRDAILLTGAMIDPRPAYAAADIVLGMGGSALRGMAFGKPVIVLGERGFSEIFEPATSKMFFWQGYYGIGDGDLSPAPLARQLETLIDDPARRVELGTFSLGVIEHRYTLKVLAADLDRMYRDAVEQRIPRRTEWLEGGRLGVRRLAAGARAAARSLRTSGDGKP